MLKPSVSPVEGPSALEEAVDDCRYALRLDNGTGTFAALYNHFAMWLYNNETECDYYVALKEIRSRLFCSNCLLTRDEKGRKLPGIKTPHDIRG